MRIRRGEHANGSWSLPLDRHQEHPAKDQLPETGCHLGCTKSRPQRSCHTESGRNEHRLVRDAPEPRSPNSRGRTSPFVPLDRSRCSPQADLPCELLSRPPSSQLPHLEQRPSSDATRSPYKVVVVGVREVVPETPPWQSRGPASRPSTQCSAKRVGRGSRVIPWSTRGQSTPPAVAGAADISELEVPDAAIVDVPGSSEPRNDLGNNRPPRT